MSGQLSRSYCYPICDKWDSDPNMLPKVHGELTYASKGAPASAEVLVDPGEGAATPAARPAIGRRADTPLPCTASSDTATAEVVLAPDLSAGLAAYQRNALSLARHVVRAGPARGVVTFAAPVSLDDVRGLASRGIAVECIEAVTTDMGGHRWTFGAPMEDGVDAWLVEQVAATGEELLGVVSAQVVIDDEAGLEAVSASDDVWLVDLAVEHHGRSNPGARDVVMNDLFWKNAGWTE